MCLSVNVHFKWSSSTVLQSTLKQHLFALVPTALCTKTLKIQWNCMNNWKCFPLEFWHNSSARFQNWNLSDARLNAVCPLPEWHVRQPYIKMAPEVDHNICGVSSVNSKHTNFKHRQPEGWLASQWGWLNAQCGCSAAPFPDRHKSHCQRGMSGPGGCLWSCLCLSLEKWGWKVTNPKEKCGAGSRFSSH